jgi:hypothetical protein
MADEPGAMIAQTSPSTGRVVASNLAGAVLASTVALWALPTSSALVVCVGVAGAAALNAWWRPHQVTLSFDGTELRYVARGGARASMAVSDITAIRATHGFKTAHVLVDSKDGGFDGLGYFGHANVLQAVIERLDELGRGDIVDPKVAKAVASHRTKE